MCKAWVHEPAQNLRFGLGFPMGWFCRIIHAFILIFRDGDVLISILDIHAQITSRDLHFNCQANFREFP